MLPNPNARATRWHSWVEDSCSGSRVRQSDGLVPWRAGCGISKRFFQCRRRHARHHRKTKVVDVSRVSTGFKIAFRPVVGRSVSDACLRHVDWRFTEWSRRETSDIDGRPARARERERTSQMPYKSAIQKQRGLRGFPRSPHPGGYLLLNWTSHQHLAFVKAFIDRVNRVINVQDGDSRR